MTEIFLKLRTSCLTMKFCTNKFEISKVEIEIRKFEFVARIQFLCEIFLSYSYTFISNALSFSEHNFNLFNLFNWFNLFNLFDLFDLFNLFNLFDPLNVLNQVKLFKFFRTEF